MRYAHFVVEGPHDVAFVGRLLRQRGISLVDTKAALAGLGVWEPLLPVRWPTAAGKGDLTRRVPVPTFFEGSDWSIAVDSANGDSKVVQTVLGQRGALARPAEVEAIGILLDADGRQSPRDRFDAVIDGLAAEGLPVPGAPGDVAAGAPKLGVFVLPDNVKPGTLEDLLIDAAAVHFPTLLSSAQAFVSSASVATDWTKAEQAEFLRPAGQKKATVGAMGALLKPGKSIQVSVQDNRWIDATTIAQVGELGRVADFVDRLLR